MGMGYDVLFILFRLELFTVSIRTLKIMNLILSKFWLLQLNYRRNTLCKNYPLQKS